MRCPTTALAIALATGSLSSIAGAADKPNPAATENAEPGQNRPPGHHCWYRGVAKSGPDHWHGAGWYWCGQRLTTERGAPPAETPEPSRPEPRERPAKRPAAPPEPRPRPRVSEPRISEPRISEPRVSERHQAPREHQQAPRVSERHHATRHRQARRRRTRRAAPGTYDPSYYYYYYYPYNYTYPGRR